MTATPTPSMTFKVPSLSHNPTDVFIHLSKLRMPLAIETLNACGLNIPANANTITLMGPRTYPPFVDGRIPSSPIPSMDGERFADADVIAANNLKTCMAECWVNRRPKTQALLLGSPGIQAPSPTPVPCTVRVTEDGSGSTRVSADTHAEVESNLPRPETTYPCEACGHINRSHPPKKWYAIVKGLDVGVKYGDEAKACIQHPEVHIRGVYSRVYRTREEAEEFFAQALTSGEVEVLEITPDMRRK